MPRYNVHQTIKVRRQGKPYYVEPNQIFEFSDGEAKDALSGAPGSLSPFHPPVMAAVPLDEAPAAPVPVAKGKGRAKHKADESNLDDDEL